MRQGPASVAVAAVRNTRAETRGITPEKEIHLWVLRSTLSPQLSTEFLRLSPPIREHHPYPFVRNVRACPLAGMLIV